MDDNVLRCNNSKCRKVLEDRAALTVCRPDKSHIFCLECAEDFDLGSQRKEHRRRSCPACKAELTDQDESSIKNLNPSERVKSELLIGLAPHSIIECALRAMHFWGYQWSQEAFMQDHQCRRLKDKYLNVQLGLETKLANSEAKCQALENQVEESKAKTNSYRQKLDDITRAYRARTEDLRQAEERTAQMRHASVRGQLQEAAHEAIDHAVRDIDTRRISEEDDGRDSHTRGSNFFPPVPPFGTRHRGGVQQPNRALSGPALQRASLQREDPFGWPRREPLGRSDYPSQPTNGRRSRPTLASPAERALSSRVLGRQMQSKGSIRSAHSPKIPTRHHNFPDRMENLARHFRD